MQSSEDPAPEHDDRIDLFAPQKLPAGEAASSFRSPMQQQTTEPPGLDFGRFRTISFDQPAEISQSEVEMTSDGSFVGKKAGMDRRQAASDCTGTPGVSAQK